MTQYQLFAPAKVNLDLRILGRREDGYHDLRSHVVFADVGDTIDMVVSPAQKASCVLSVTGSFAHQLQAEPHEENLVVRAVSAFCTEFDRALEIDLILHKNLPCGSGLGGGSSDAASVLRGLMDFCDLSHEKMPLALLMRLGADVPVCYYARPCLMEGLGERLTFADTLPDQQHAVLIWPGPGESTQALYQAWDKNPGSGANENDFEAIAGRFCPNIFQALATLRALPGCHTARLTGSGSACFGLFDVQPGALPEMRFPWISRCVLGEAKKPLATVAR